MPEGFAPVADENARLAILGTMPSVLSLQKQQYYGHAQNTFWRILFSLWEEQVPESYEQRTAFLKEKKIALWDVLMSCERQGSADTAIRLPRPNDFTVLAGVCPKLEAIFFNSKNAAELYSRLIRPDPFASLPKTILPSTSPARAMQFEKKRDLWLPVYQFLH